MQKSAKSVGGFADFLFRGVGCSIATIEIIVSIVKIVAIGFIIIYC